MSEENKNQIEEVEEVEEPKPPPYLSYAKDIAGGSPEKALALAAIKIAEELHKLVELMTPKTSTIPTPRPQPSDVGELAQRLVPLHPKKGE